MVEPKGSVNRGANSESPRRPSSTTSQSTIPVAVDTLTNTLKTLYLHTTSAVDNTTCSIWTEFSENIEIIINNCYFSQTRGIREYWSSETKRDVDGSREMLQLIHDLMTASQRTLLPAAVYAIAETTDYDITVPIDILWDSLCTEPFSSWVRENAAYDSSVQFAQHILLYTDETYTKTKSGLFIYEKIELILNTLYIYIRDYILISVLGLSSSPPSTRKEGVSHKNPVLHKDGDDHDNNKLGFAQCSNKRGADMEAVRYTLDRFLRDNGWGWALFKTATLTEIYFNSVTVVFRPKPAPATTVADTTPSSSIQLREYGTVPLGDLQTLLPSKSILLPPIDTILFITQLSMILLFLQYGIEEVWGSLGDATSGWDSVMIAALLVAGLLSRLATLVTGYIGTVRYYENVIERWLEGKRSGRNESALFKVSTRVVAQEVKEVLLGYFYLWRCGPLTAHDLQRRVNSFLTSEFGVVNAEFDVQDCLSKLQKMGLVTKGSRVSRINDEVEENDATKAHSQLFCIKIAPRDWLRTHSLQHLKGVSLR